MVCYIGNVLSVEVCVINVHVVCCVGRVELQIEI